MSFAAKLKDLRMRSGKSLQELADAIGISKAHVWDLETGKSKNPSLELSDHFKVSVATLVGEDTDDEELRVMFRQLQELDPNDRKLIQSIIEAQKKIKKENE
jgi:transcriptional regulator with XRE-family HTH domain